MRSRDRSRSVRLLALVVLATFLSGCTTWSAYQWRSQDASPDEVLRLHLEGGGVVELRDVTLSGDSIVSGTTGDAVVRIERDAIVRVEAREVSTGRTALLLAGIGLAAVAGFALFLAALPSCDGGGC